MATVTPENAQAVCDLYTSGLTVREAASRVGLMTGQASRILARSGIRAIARPDKLSAKKLALLRQLYTRGTPTAEIASRVGVSQAWISSVIRRLGIPLRSVGQQTVTLRAAQKRKLVREWRSGKSLHALQQSWGHEARTIRRLLADAGVRFAPRHNAGPKHSMWRGGRTITKGYWQVWSRDDETFASMRSKSGHILEHRLVMARHLGRPLSRRETVHHINGDKLDNRLENLQLRQGPHGRNECFRCRACGSRDIEAVPIADTQ